MPYGAGRGGTELEIPFMPLNELLAQADIVTVHVPALAQTRGMFGAAQFARMKQGALYQHESRRDV